MTYSFSCLGQSALPCPVLTVSSWPAYRFLRKQIRWSGIPISFRIFHSLLWSTQSKALAYSIKQMFFCNSLAFLLIQRMLLICSLVPLTFLNPAGTSGSYTDWKMEENREFRSRPTYICLLDLWISESRSVMSNSLQPNRLYSHWNSPGQNSGVSSCSLLQEIFPTQGSKPNLLHCRWILY